MPKLVPRIEPSRYRVQVSAEANQRDAERASNDKEITAIDLRALRVALNVSQAELAARLGRTQPVVSQLERRRDHRLSTLRRYVEALGAELELVTSYVADRAAEAPKIRQLQGVPAPSALAGAVARRPAVRIRKQFREAEHGGGPDRTADLGIMSPKKLSAPSGRSMALSTVFPLTYGR